MVRRELLPTLERDRLDYAHTELHILYITAVELFATVAFIWWSEIEAFPLQAPITVAVVCLVAAIVADINQHSIEFDVLVKRKEDVMNFLMERGYVTSEMARGVQKASAG